MREDEIVQVLGGPDAESDDFSIVKAESPVETRHRVVPFEIGISRLFRTRRLLQAFDEAYYDEADSVFTVGYPRGTNIGIGSFGYHQLQFLTNPTRPQRMETFSQATCLRCHKDVTELYSSIFADLSICSLRWPSSVTNTLCLHLELSLKR